MNTNRTIGIAVIVLILCAGGYMVWFAMKPKGIAVSPFATSGDLTDADREYRTKMFDYALDSVAAGQTYTWTSPSAQATIKVEDYYTSKSQSDCRKYAEVYIVGKEQYNAAGTACRRNGNSGWCRIPAGGAETCALESPRNAGESATQKLNDAGESASEALGKARGLLR